MTMFELILYFVKALPEAFKLMKQAAEMPTADSASKDAEISAGIWSL